MEKYHFNISIDIKYHHAGTKANVDCKTILLRKGYKDFEIDFKKAAYLFPVNLIKLISKLISFYYKIPKGSLVITQYPLLGINKYFYKYTRFLRAKKCNVGCIIHDLDSLRDKKEFAVKNDITALSAYDILIAHNSAMKQWLTQAGYKGKIVEIQLFDFLTDFENRDTIGSAPTTEIVFAGHLGKCEFLKDIDQVKGVKFNLYGPGLPSGVNQNPDVQWHGSFPIDEIIYKIEGAYGLIWDGPSIYECTGNMGNYLKYNTPHKLSLYLTAGIPVILPQTAALAGFVKENNIGITVNSLTELEEAISKVEPNHYASMKNNAVAIGALLKRGHYFSNALQHVEQICETNEVFNQP